MKAIHALQMSMVIVVFFSFILLCTQALGQTEHNATQTIVVTLKNRTPQELIPVLTSFIDKNSKVKAFENQLIIQSTTGNMQSIRDLIDKLDIPVAKLMISISNGKDKPSNIVSVKADGKVIMGNQGMGQSSITYGTSRESDRQISHIRVDDGQVAAIDTGVTIPMIEQQFAANDNSSASLNAKLSNSQTGHSGSISGKSQESAQAGGQSYEFQNLSYGLLVKPHMYGKQVRLELMSKNDQPGNSIGDNTQATYSTFSAQTTVSINLGEWVNLGSNQSQEESSNYSYHTQDKSQASRALWVRVDLIPNQ